MEITRFWAKTTNDKENYPNAFHPLICHLIDVGAAAHALWKNVLPEITKQRLAECFGLKDKPEKAGRLIAFLIGLHDLGKCSPPFALRGEYDKQTWKDKQTVRLLELYRNTEYFCGGFKSASAAPHNFVTSIVLPPILEEKFGFKTLLAKNVAEIIGGHHGTFPDSNYLTKNTGDDYCGDKLWRAAQREIVETLAELFEVEDNFSHLPNTKLGNATAMIFAGLTTTADWIGSNADFFKCEVKDSTKPFSLEADKYFEESKQKANEALKTLGWSKWVAETKEKEFDELFPVLKEKHRDLQNVAIEMAKDKELDAVGIAIIESPMGEGKTEAAMYLADTWNARLGTRGIYFALPTQATSNQMFSRIADFLEARFHGEDLNVQLLLSHGHSSISAEFTEKIENFRNIQNISDEADATAKQNFSNIAAAEWFTYKKKGLLVPFGVGTIDQILLGVLQTKHVFVRLFGLAHKTVIIDEVHAYDAYMSTLLERLLEWLAALGSPVVILSATLPKKKRDALVKAYLKGLGQKFEDDEKPENTGETDEYPRISYATAAMPDKTFIIRGLKTSTQNTKTLYLEWKNENNFVEELKAKLANGGCAAIICNTVDKAQTLLEQLSNDKFFQGSASDDLPKLDLLHARFRFTDREMREKRSLARFAKPGKDGKSPHRPHTAILISTQIIEQSLDLDFDLMISELAPADLLMQRAGRLQRHERTRLPAFKSNESENKPTLWIIKPETDAHGDLLTNDKDLPRFGKSGFVYDNHILFRSWLKLKDEKQIEIPGGIENLIEDVYNKKRECFDEKHLNAWNATKISSDKKLAEKRIKAKAVYLTDFDDDDFYDSFKLQLDEDDPEKHSTLRAQTRDEERPTVAIILLTHDEAWSINLNINPTREMSEFIIKREVKISRNGLTQAILANPDFKKIAWEKNALLRHHRLLVLNENKQILVSNTTITLDDEKGVVYENKGGISE